MARRQIRDGLTIGGLGLESVDPPNSPPKLKSGMLWRGRGEAQ